MLFSCYNRMDYTRRAICQLIETNSTQTLFVVVDDGSEDGTLGTLNNLNDMYENIHIIETGGGSYYSRSMLQGMEYIKNEHIYSDYIVLINDDVDFNDSTLDRMITYSRENENAVIVGPTQNSEGNRSYGGVRYSKKGLKITQERVIITDSDNSCNTFNANCVLIPWAVFEKVGVYDRHYVHGLADFDYGLRMSGYGVNILQFPYYIGKCNRNSIKGTWRDITLKRFERLKMKESPKGDPIGPWFYFLQRNFGLASAVVYSLSPYVRIMFGK